MNFMPLLEAASGNPLNSVGFLIPMLLVFIIFYFLLIRPQKKEQQKTEQMISQLQKGDKVITIGGIHGVVSSTKEKTIIIKIDEDCKIEINRSAIGMVLKDEPVKPAPNFGGEAQKKKSFFGRKAKDSNDFKN